jgi:energy-coupling factor transporter ATP-binding protein EcfA2
LSTAALSVRETAFLALDLGLSPLPPKEDGSKAPLADIQGKDGWTWAPYQTTPASIEHVREWYVNGRSGLGLVGGYGGLDPFEFDCRDTYDRYLEAAVEMGLGDLVDRVRTGYEEFTPGGGVHWLFRCSKPLALTKLAQRPAPTEKDPHARKTLIETKGNGGFIIIAPSNGKVHQTGGAYKLVCGGLRTMATLSPDERDLLWELARSFDETPHESKSDPDYNPWTMTVTNGQSIFPKQGKRIGEDFAERTSWEEILEQHQWVRAGARGDDVYWRRPGKDRGISATTGHCKGLKVFTTSTSLKTDGTYTKLGAYAALNFRGDFKEAIKDLAAKGFGTWLEDDGTERQNPVPKEWFAKQKAKQSQGQPGGTVQTDWMTLSDEELGLIGANDVKEAPINWLWPYRFAEGEMAILAGDGGLGKSSLLLAIASLITKGDMWPDGSGMAPLGDVIIVSAEDSRETTLKPRLMALQADLSRIKFVTARAVIKKPGQAPIVNPMTLQDIPYWQELMRRVPGCKMLIIDPLPSYLGRGVNDSKNGELRSVVEPFIERVTRPAGACFVANTHLNKNVDSKTPMHRITGSMAYGNLPRNVHFVMADPDNEGRAFFKQGKCNNAPKNLPAIAYELVKTTIPSAAGEIETSYPVFDAATVQVDLQEAMSAPRGKRGPAPEKTTAVALWLLEYLRAQPAPSSLRDVFNAAGAMGFVGEQKPDKKGYMRWSIPGTLYRAKEDMVPQLGAPNGGWVIEDIKCGGIFWQAVRKTGGNTNGPY